MSSLITKGAGGKNDTSPNILSDPGAILLNHCCPETHFNPFVNTVRSDMFTSTPVDACELMHGHTRPVSVN